MNPERNIFGLSSLDVSIVEKINQIKCIFPKSTHENYCLYEEAELVKYAGNSFLYMKVVFANIIFDICNKLDVNYDVVKTNMSLDTRIGDSHLSVSDIFRGAGGNCFIKDFAAMSNFLEEVGLDEKSKAVFKSVEDKNLELLCSTGKDTELVEIVYGTQNR